MPIFGKKQPETGPRPDPDLEARVAALERRWETIDHEWTEWYDKFRRLHARLAKRQQRALAEDVPESTNGHPTITNPAALALLNRR